MVRREFILGGQRSGKSRRAEALAQQWLSTGSQRSALLVATAEAGDAEMRARIARHRSDRARRMPLLETIEEPRDLAATLLARSDPDTIIVVDCLTLWLSNWLMPWRAAPQAAPQGALIEALSGVSGPVVLVSNEIGLGVIPMGAEVRGFVDALGQLNQAVAGACDRVTFMAAGLPLVLKGTVAMEAAP